MFHIKLGAEIFFSKTRSKELENKFQFVLKLIWEKFVRRWDCCIYSEQYEKLIFEESFARSNPDYALLLWEHSLTK